MSQSKHKMRLMVSIWTGPNSPQKLQIDMFAEYSVIRCVCGRLSRNNALVAGFPQRDFGSAAPFRMH